jgi:dipeptidyl aminopeptidase/acylaminoacyl peptidase
MRPRFTLRSFFLLLVAGGIAGGLWLWRSLGSPLPGGEQRVDTAGKLAFVRTTNKGQQHDIFLVNADGTGAVPLTNDPAEDRTPAWAPNGAKLALISDRDGNGYQVFLLDPKPGAKPDLLTITSSSKDQPVFGADGRVYYLASGQLVATAPGTSDADAIFPPPDLRLKFSQLLGTGGLDWARPSPDLKNVAAILRLENGRALLLSPLENSVPLLVVGTGQNIEASWLPDNTLITLIRGGSFATQPGVLLDAQSLQDPNYLMPALPPASKADTNYLVHFAADGKPLSVLELPAAPSGFAPAPDGTRAAFTGNGGEGAGVAVLSFTSGSPQPFAIFRKPAHSPAWSPDGKTLAFVSGNDIYTVVLDPAATTPPVVVNLTKGEGVNSSPVWSPALPKTAVAKQ